MAEKKRYLVGYRHNAAIPAGAAEQIEQLMAASPEAKRLRKLPSGRHVVEMTEEQASKLAASDPNIAIEEDQELKLFSPFPGLPPRVPLGAGKKLAFAVTDGETGAPIAGASVYLPGKGLTYKATTGADGRAEVVVHEEGLSRAIVSPIDTYWSKVVDGPFSDGGPLAVKLTKLPVHGQFTWGADALRVDKVCSRFTGRGVKVAIIDSGIAPHPDLHVVDGFNTLDGQDPDAWNVDDEGHGTHCCGVVAAKANDVGVRGVAPDAEIFSVKVFPGGRLSDLLEAVAWCVDRGVDVVSMSLGMAAPSDQLEQALADAVSRGITCVAAAGNEGGPVAYPAAFASCIAVGAIGMVGSFPEDAAHALRRSDHLSADGQYFAASFTDYGPQVALCAPGVAVISTVPTGYAAWDGTSMACPFVAGLAALALEGYPQLRTGDAMQPEHVRQVLVGSTTDLGIATELQGTGLANAGLALRAAHLQRSEAEQALASYRQYLENVLGRVRGDVAAMETTLTELRAE